MILILTLPFYTECDALVKKEEFGLQNRKFNFGHVKFEVPGGHTCSVSMGDHLSVHVKILDLGIIGISMVIETLGLKRESEKNL